MLPIRRIIKLMRIVIVVMIVIVVIQKLGQPGLRKRRRAAAEAAPRHAEVRLQVLPRHRERRGRGRAEGPHHGPGQEVQEGNR